LDKAAKIVFGAEINLTFNNPSFSYFRDQCINSAKQLFGNCSVELKSTINAWAAVGVGLNVDQSNNLYLFTEIPSYQTDYQYSVGVLNSISILQGNTNVKYEASSSISLKPGFHAKNNSDFHAEIVPCSTSYGKSVNFPSINDENLKQEEKIIALIETFPNPIENKLSVKNDSGIKFTTFELLDLSGNILFENKFDQLDLLQIDNLASGFYYLKLKSSEHVITKKIQKL
jgi:hypothetical protein